MKSFDNIIIIYYIIGAHYALIEFQSRFIIYLEISILLIIMCDAIFVPIYMMQINTKI